MDKERLSVVALNSVSSLTPKKIISLIDYFGSAENVLSADAKEFQTVFEMPEKIVSEIKKVSDLSFAEREIDLAEKNNIKIVTYKDETYPEQLKNICDYPPVLYIKGNYDNKKDHVSVSIVGSRRATNYGKTVTDNFCKYFAQNSITTVSGLAGGIDTQAHVSTLKNSGKTVAVLGNGLLYYYPAENRKLQEQIYEKGAVISEFALNQRPDKINFPRRNRIVAALSLATVVVEAAIKSGSLITADLACDYGKDVFAVPGPVFSKYSQGTNNLIKSGAYIALTPQDVCEQNVFLYDTVKKIKKKKAAKNINSVFKGDKSSINVLKMIQSSINGLSLDEISAKTNIPVSQLSVILLELELSGYIKSVPGQIYIRMS